MPPSPPPKDPNPRFTFKGLLGGRAAEDVVYGEVSTGAENDLERATSLARQMICMYGMNDQMGLMHCARARPMFLPAQDGSLHRDCSPSTAQIIDEQVKKLLDDAHRDAKQILVEHRDQLELVAKELLLRESIDAAKFNRLIGSTSAGDGQPALPTQGTVGGT